MTVKNIQTIFEYGDNELGVDHENRLYWNKKPIKIEKKISLNFWQGLGSFLIVISTVTMAIFSVLTYFYKS